MAKEGWLALNGLEQMKTRHCLIDHIAMQALRTELDKVYAAASKATPKTSQKKSARSRA